MVAKELMATVTSHAPILQTHRLTPGLKSLLLASLPQHRFVQWKSDKFIMKRHLHALLKLKVLTFLQLNASIILVKISVLEPALLT